MNWYVCSICATVCKQFAFNLHVLITLICAIETQLYNKYNDYNYMYKYIVILAIP